MTPSEKCLDLIKEFEGLRLKAYDDGGKWAIGYGCQKYFDDPKNPDIGPHDVISKMRAESILSCAVRSLAEKVYVLIAPVLTQNQFDAIMSFTYNVGLRAFESSTLLKLVNNKEFELARQEFLKWDHVNGQVVRGLWNRRVAESVLFML